MRNLFLFESVCYRLVTSLLVVLLSATVMAVPARRVKKTLTLADGTNVEAVLAGDENGHWWMDSDGRALREDSLGVASYITTEAMSARLAASSNRLAASNARRASRMRTSSADYTGSKRGLVILVNFSNLAMKSANTQSAFNNQFNQAGYSKNSHTGSVRDYFLDQSYQKFAIDFDVVGPVTVSKTYSYYGANDENDEDKYPATMVIEACRLANAAGVDFSQYDWDGDGYVDQVFLVYAGYGEAQGAAANTIWPHEWSLAEAATYGDGTGSLTMDGKKIDTYAVSCELSGTSGSTMDGIGTACHEFSHCLGFPDFYDSSYAGGAGMMDWDLLCSGSYNGPNNCGECPAGYTSYERAAAGWLTPIELTDPCTIKDMPCLSDEPVAYVLYNEKNSNEYYMLENRQAQKWDKYTYGTGLLVLHVDYSETAWYENTVNNEASHQRMTYIPADNSYGTYYSEYGQWIAGSSDMKGDTYPGSNNNTSLTDTSTPAASLYNANSDGRKYMGKPIEDIEESSDGLISFRFDGGVQIPAPDVKAASNITSTGFTANWSKVEEATSYNLEVVETDSTQVAPEVVTMISESFAKMTKIGSSDISSSLDKYTGMTGWKGSKIYEYPEGVRIGSGSSQGYIVTPLIDAPSNGMATLNVSLQKYSSDTQSVTISILNSSGTVMGYTTATPTSSMKTYIIPVTGLTYDFKVKIANSASKRRFYIYNVEVTDTVSAAMETVHNFTGITETSYDVTGLTAGNTFKYRVKALNDDGASAWSDYMNVVGNAADVNGDGSVDISDVNAVLNTMLGGTDYENTADVNKDGTVDIADVNAVLSAMLAK